MSVIEELEPKARNIADHAIMVLAARFMIVFGIPAVIGIAGWGLGTTIDVQVRLGRMEQWAKDAGTDRYHGADAARDFAIRDVRIDQNVKDIAKLDGRISYIERRMPPYNGPKP